MSAVWFLLGFGAASLVWSIVLGLCALANRRDENEVRRELRVFKDDAA